MSAPAGTTIAPAEVNRSFVLQKCDYFVDVQLWPLKRILDPERWLSNFQPNELQHAVHLLNAFTYYPEAMVDQLFVSAFQSLSRLLRRPGESFIAAQRAWQTFNDRVLISIVTGEIPSVTDSGYNFARKAKQLLGVSEDRILSPEETLQELYRGGPQPIVFVDDFVGSGEQFVATWLRDYKVSDTITSSFSAFAKKAGGKYYYCPLVCTELGLSTIKRECPEVVMSPAHILPSKYSAIDPESLIWPVQLRATAHDFILGANTRAGIPASSSFGFRRLALAIAFSHGVPDATLPLFTWNENGWKPLIRPA